MEQTALHDAIAIIVLPEDAVPAAHGQSAQLRGHWALQPTRPGTEPRAPTETVKHEKPWPHPVGERATARHQSCRGKNFSRQRFFR